MRRKKRNVITAIIAVLMMSGVFQAQGKEVQAASATIKLEATSENIQEGDAFSVTIAITSTATIGEVSQEIKYDAEILEFKPETGAYEEKDGVITIKDSNPSDKNQKYILQFKAVKQGVGRVFVTGTPEIYSTSGNILSLSKNALSINVGAKTERSANRNLASLEVKEGKLTNSFNPYMTEYEVNVGQDVKAVTVLAKPEDKASKVEITGADKLLVGKNTVTIKVTSETNKTKEYILYVNRGMTAEETPTPTPLQPQEMENGVKVEEQGGRLILSVGAEYEILSVQNLRELPKGYLSVALAIDNHAVDAYQKEDASNKEMYLIYARHGQGEAGFYQYDSKEGTIQRYTENLVHEDMPLQTITVEQYNKKVRELGSIVGAAAGLVVLFAMLAYRFYKRSKE